MIPISSAQWQSEAWKKEYADAICEPERLLDYLQLPSSLLTQARQAARQFPLRVPISFVKRMQKARPDDPLLLQVLPLSAESQPQPDYALDPVGDLDANPIPGLIHKYHDRALIMLSGACAVHCRYCFRRHFPYADHGLHTDNWQAILDYAAEHSLSEIIFSGGDPWSLSDEKIERVLTDICNLPALRRIRWHTRLPVMIPSRVTDKLLHLLARTRQSQIVVLHINHPQEIDAALLQAMHALRNTGITLLNQSVLLRHINDSVETLAELSHSLFAAGALPYYLHELDKVDGAAHFHVPRQQARAILQELAARLPGYLVPRYVVEERAAPNKTFL